MGYYLLTGRHVFEGGSAVEICARHLNDLPEPPSRRIRSGVPEDLERIILGCLEKDPEHRPASAASLVEELLACRDAGGWTQRDARQWWHTHTNLSSGSGSPREAPPLTNTELLVDLDSRLASIRANHEMDSQLATTQVNDDIG